ncbi:MAG: hypothetical protein EBS48_06550 [Actinobacteria bacterium]|nr:hypothetical protein [Actinomycetota bacterium]
MPIDPCQEYFVDLGNRTVTGPDGVTVSQTVRTRSPRPIPKGRNPLNKPLVGDLLRSPTGRLYIVVQERFRESLTLAEYLGDIPACPLYSAVGTGRIPMDNLFLLTMDGWTVDNRFPLKKPEVSHGA